MKQCDVVDLDDPFGDFIHNCRTDFTCHDLTGLFRCKLLINIKVSRADDLHQGVRTLINREFLTTRPRSEAPARTWPRCMTVRSCLEVRWWTARTRLSVWRSRWASDVEIVVIYVSWVSPGNVWLSGREVLGDAGLFLWTEMQGDTILKYSLLCNHIIKFENLSQWGTCLVTLTLII